MKTLLSWLVVPALAGLLSGCASTGLLKAYSGPERPGDQVATVILPASVEVRSINGAQQPSITHTLLKPVYTIAVLPGEQEWSLRYYAPLAGGYYDQRNEVSESPWLPFKFKAEAGSVYHMTVETPRENPHLQNTAEKVRFRLEQEKKAVAVAATMAPQQKQPLEPAPAVVLPTAKTAAPQTLENAAFEQLKSWWGVAGPHERQSFRDWLKSQP